MPAYDTVFVVGEGTVLVLRKSITWPVCVDSCTSLKSVSQLQETSHSLRKQSMCFSPPRRRQTFLSPCRWGKTSWLCYYYYYYSNRYCSVLTFSLSLVNVHRSEVNTELYIWSPSMATFTCTTWSREFVSTWIESARRQSLWPLHMKPPQESLGLTRRVRLGTGSKWLINGVFFKLIIQTRFLVFFFFSLP